MTALNLVGAWVAAFITLAVFSFLYKDNPFYKFAEHLFVGVSTGYWIVILYTTSLKDLLLLPFRESLALFSDPAAGFFTALGKLALTLLPGVMGLLLFTRFHPKYAWISRISIAYIMGLGSGAAIPIALQTMVVKQLWATMVPLWAGPGLATINNLVIVAGVICGLLYFFFSTEHKGLVGGASKAGIYVLMSGFGATFGYTVMSRISLLLGRVQFLVDDWFRDALIRPLFG